MSVHWVALNLLLASRTGMCGPMAETKVKKLGKFMLAYCDDECNEALKAYFSYQVARLTKQLPCAL